MKNLISKIFFVLFLTNINFIQICWTNLRCRF